jgi:hypothetical protein
MNLNDAIHAACHKFGYPHRVSPYTGLVCIGQTYRNYERIGVTSPVLGHQARPRMQTP